MCGAWPLSAAYKDDWEEVDCGRCLRIGKQKPKFTRIRIKAAIVENAPANFRKLVFNNCTQCKFAKGYTNDDVSCTKHGKELDNLHEHMDFHTVCDDFEDINV